ncbi:MAG: hypothetical protein ABF899_05100 [Oenococcus sp.]|uniref:hypothetical protein n=1 Tax=Oenococcus sp. TaxID=1979414 RepID=UPI0039ED8FA0
MIEQKLSNNRRAEYVDIFSEVSDTIFQLCSDRINNRIGFLEQISGNKITQEQTALSKSFTRPDVDVGAINRILKNNHKEGKNKFLFPVLSAKKYYLAFQEELGFPGPYEILWGTMSEICNYLPTIFVKLCQAECRLEKKLMSDKESNDQLTENMTPIQKRLENFSGKNFEDQCEDVYRIMRVSVLEDWVIFTTNQTENNFAIVENRSESEVSGIEGNDKVNDSVPNEYRGFAEINRSLCSFAEGPLLRIIGQGIYDKK